jgi:predicted DNA-binding transcriptional regulator AlpA
VPANPPLKLHDSSSTQQNTSAIGAPIVEPLLVPAQVAGPICGVSKATWWRLHAAGKVPAPVRLGGRTLWRRAELVAFCEAGCPDRKTWDALKATRKGGRA